ncbi:hypothetical protein B0F90DRAFT_1632750 [Multifurca ochricompacta]|uniref:Uncharacterized protein n=1 Tax=Multifurca ochricompacta TaxID=376703 RepID=A0AAD4M208_9AGAM|nr:hypothetical protein B0F90DRAFT_1632750 [Multifurca ochricompacta]
MTSVHRRKSSREEDENFIIASNGTGKVTGHDDLPPRNRAVSPTSGLPSPSSSSFQPPSAGPFRTGSTLPQSNKSNGFLRSSPSLRSTFSTPAHLHVHGGTHSRTRSISGPFTPTSPSPLSMSFPSQDIPFSTSNSVPSFTSSATLPEFPRGSRAHAHTRTNSHSQPSLNNSEPLPSPSASTHALRHSRLHSRNLSIFFPRPGSLPHNIISEDGTQELEIESHTEVSSASAVSIPSASPTISRFGEGFTFGSRPPPDIDSGTLADEQPALPRASRRGHHHKHSLSHNFFSFLEPGSTGLSSPTSQPTPTPISPRTPPSPYPKSATSSTVAFPRAPSEGSSPVSPLSDSSTSPFSHLQSGGLPIDAIVASVGQFTLGALLWITGQGVGSLACTGLGYWVVFDAIGVGVNKVLPAYLQRSIPRIPVRRPFGTRRLETLALFAQVVYLMFSAVYVFKETVEHVLLSAGEGHHHHPGDEDVEVLGIDFPTILAFLTLISLFANSFLFDNHNKLVVNDNISVPPLSSLLFDLSRSRYPSSQQPQPAEPSSWLDRILRNPFSLVPIGSCTLILVISSIIPSSSHRTFDLLLAAAEAMAMFHLAYPSCKTIGAILLQTAPARGVSAGRMESFLRAMREIERHPQVLHLPPPHIWQLAPSVGSPQPLVVTLELRVSPDLGDTEVLKLTRWAWERCTLALGLAGREQDGGGVTVGIVRG